MSDYMPKVDSALLMISTILYLVRNEQAKSKDPAAKVLEVPTEETLAENLDEILEAPTEPADMVGLHEETVVTEDNDDIINAPTKPENEDCDKIFEAHTEPVDKDSEEYKRRLKEASNRFLAASGKLDVTCPLNIHSGYSTYDC